MGKYNRDFNIVLAHRGPWMGLWMTINSCEMALQGTDFNYSYIVVANGDKRISDDLFLALSVLKQGDKLDQFVVHPNPMSPPSARQFGTVFGDGDYLFFFDNHCLVRPDYFTRAITKMKERDIAMLHSTTRFHADSKFAHEYILSLEQDFWSRRMAERPMDKKEPYRIGVAGHGGFVVRRDVWERLGGYWNGFVGYGGEETYWDLKCWLHGVDVWLDPKLVHHHFPGEREYKRHFTNDYFRNMMMCANMIGGDEWLWKVYDNFTRTSKPIGTNLYNLMDEAVERSRGHASELAASRIRTLEETLDYFKANDIPH